MNRSIVLLLLSFVWNLQNELAISASFMRLHLVTGTKFSTRTTDIRQSQSQFIGSCERTPILKLVYAGDSSNKGCFGRKTNLLRESGNLGKFPGNLRYYQDIEQKFDITCYQTIYVPSDMHPAYALYFMYFDAWKRIYSPWYEKTNQQCFQLK